MKYAVTYILFATILIGEIHTFFGKDIVSVEVNGKRVLTDKHGNLVKKTNWIIARHMPRTLQRNIKDTLCQLNFILYFVAFYLYGKTPNRINKITVITFMWFMILDAIMYFYNDKTFGYYIVYFLIAIIWVTLYKVKKLKTS